MTSLKSTHILVTRSVVNGLVTLTSKYPRIGESYIKPVIAERTKCYGRVTDSFYNLGCNNSLSHRIKDLIRYNSRARISIIMYNTNASEEDATRSAYYDELEFYRGLSNTNRANYINNKLESVDLTEF